MTEQLPLRFEPPPRWRAQDWVDHAGVVEAAGRLVDFGDGVLALVGPEGSGKSHLARLWAGRKGAQVLDGPAMDLTDGPVVVEDADRLAGDEALFHLFNRAAQPGRGLLLTGRTPPRSWPATVPDLRSRYNAVEVVELTQPDEAGLAELLGRAFRARQVRPGDGVVAYLSRRIERSAAAAAAVVARLNDAALAAGRPVNRAFASELLGDQPDLFSGDGESDGTAST